jgi:hypothetical protein
MAHQAAASADSTVHRNQQAIKWMVYTLLIINFVFYVFEDWNRAVVIKIVVWLLILLAIEIVVRLEGRGITGGAIISTANRK